MVATRQSLTLADEGARLRRLTRLGFAVVWLAPGLLSALQYAFVGDSTGTRYPLGIAVIWQGAAWLTWSIWSQTILSAIDRVRLGAIRLAPWLGFHFAASLVVALANLLAIAWLDHTFGSLGQVTSYAFAFRQALASHLDVQVVLYWAVLGAGYMVEFVRRFRERDRAAAELEQKLARTQLDALRMQLNPHFLFNALNSITELMEQDVREAQRTLTRVGDLLRLSLKSAGSSTIPLWQEIELVELYLQIARVRYGNGLEVDMEVDSAAVDLDVPSFILQPIVENALKHGLAPGGRGQQISVVARRSADALSLIVEDNGRGLDGLTTTSGRFLAARPSVDGLGIGLTNTRSRLTMLYGDRFAFHMSNTAGGGCRVEMRLPID
jgi:signal transduction histidine kinase